MNVLVLQPGHSADEIESWKRRFSSVSLGNKFRDDQKQYAAIQVSANKQDILSVQQSLLTLGQVEHLKEFYARPEATLQEKRLIEATFTNLKHQDLLYRNITLEP